MNWVFFFKIMLIERSLWATKNDEYVFRSTSQFSSLVLVFTVFLRTKPSPKEKRKIFDRKQGCEFQSSYIQASHHYYQLIQHIIV